MIVTDLTADNTDFIGAADLDLDGLTRAEATAVCRTISYQWVAAKKVHHRPNPAWGLPVTPVGHDDQRALQLAAALEYPEGLDEQGRLAAIPAQEVQMWKSIASHGVQAVNAAIVFTQVFQLADQERVLRWLRMKGLQPAPARA